MKWEFLLWVPTAALSGYLVSRLGAGRFRLKRNLFLVVYVPVSAVLITLFYSRSSVGIIEHLLSRPAWGIAGALTAGAIAVRHVVAQRPFPRRKGARLALDLFWPGAVYGFVDAMLLSVIPVAVVSRSMESVDWTGSIAGAWVPTVTAFAASMVVTLFYHWGYPEYRGNRVIMTLVGNGVFTAALLLTGSAMAAVLPHMAMHVAAVWHGRETTYQLPPHYQTNTSFHFTPEGGSG